MGTAAIVTGSKIYAEIVSWSLLGVVVGRTVDTGLGVVKEHLDRSMKTWPVLFAKWLNVFTQMLLVAAVPVIFHVIGLRPFVEDWQKSTRGLFCASFFLAMQNNLLSTIQR